MKSNTQKLQLEALKLILAAARGNQSEAAKAMGMGRSSGARLVPEDMLNRKWGFPQIMQGIYFYGLQGKFCQLVQKFAEASWHK